MRVILLMAGLAIGLAACAQTEVLPDLPAVPTPMAQAEDAG